MRLKSFLVFGMTFFLIFLGNAQAENDTYYARCNLKILKGKVITWVNWQAAPEILPAGTKVKISGSGPKPTLTDIASGKEYILDLGNEGEQYLNKFVSRKPPQLKKFSQKVRENIRQAVARVDMTKEAVYIAMGPPSWIPKNNTDINTYEDIMKADLWIYKRRRFAKNIGVEFDGKNGKVIRTEGIWR